MTQRLHSAALLAASLLTLAGAAAAQAHVAHFDTQSEGSLGTSYVEDGISFSNLDQYLGGGSGPFVAEDASSTLAGYTNFSSPMTLGFGGYSPGSGAGFSRCGSFKITPPVVLDQASVNLYVAGSASTGNTITLQAWFGGAVVASDAYVIPGGFGPHHREFVISGVDYDELRMVGSGSANSGAFFALVDNVALGRAALGVPFCFGGGALAQCPCGNQGASDEGCANSSGLGGVLVAEGTSSVAANDLDLVASQLPASVPSLLFNGTLQVNGGAGALFGDGLRCAGGQVQRMGVHITSATGEADWGSDLPGAFGWSAGETRYLQVWYRDVIGPCSSGFNLTHGVGVTLTP